MRWPFTFTRTHELIVSAYQDRLDAAVAAIGKEYDRAIKDGKRMVHGWVIEANLNVFTEMNHSVARSKALAAFQEAERAFASEPHQLVKEAKDATAVSAG